MVPEEPGEERRGNYGITGIEDGVPWREEGLVHVTVRVSPSVEEDPTNKQSRQHCNRPVKSAAIWRSAQFPRRARDTGPSHDHVDWFHRLMLLRPELVVPASCASALRGKWGSHGQKNKLPDIN
jgi:hypothetical protein